MHRSISISAFQKRQLLSQSAESSPNEACAVLLGRNDGGATKVLEILSARNADASPASFTIADADLASMYREADVRGLEVVAIFHSHPFSEAYPSSKDREFMLSNPVVWIIAGASDEIRAFVLDGGVREIPVMTNG